MASYINPIKNNSIGSNPHIITKYNTFTRGWLIFYINIRSAMTMIETIN